MWPMHRQNLKLLLPKVYEEMRLQENTLFDLWPWPWGQGHKNVTQYPLHHVTNAQAKLEVALSKSLWGDAFTRKHIIWPWPWGQGHTKYHPVPSTSCDLCIYKVWSCYVQRFMRRYNYKKRDGRTDRRTTDRLWYEINIPYFSNEKAGITKYRELALICTYLLFVLGVMDYFAKLSSVTVCHWIFLCTC